MQTEFWDISVPITASMPTWPGSEGFTLTRVQALMLGDQVNESHVAMGAHVGTHVDAPLHFLASGAAIDELPLSALMGPVQIIEVSSAPHVFICDVENALDASTKRVLIKTSNSGKWGSTGAFDSDYVSLAPDTARWLADRDLALLGIDYLSIEEFGGSGDVHRALLNAGVVVVEGLNLSDVEPGNYWLACLPLRIVGAEGAPARAVLMRPGPGGATA